MMEIYGTIQFRLILPHIPGFQQEPLPEPVCSHSPDCKDCPYPRHGFLCWGADGTCLRSRMNEINEKKENNDHDERSSEYTAVATYTGSATSSYVKGYTVTADYTGTVSRIALNRVRYVAIFEGTPIQPTEPVNVPSAASAFRWSYVLIPLGIVAAAGAGIGGALLVKHRKENADEEETAE